MANINLYKIFDKLHENMTRDEIVEVLYDLVELKINTNSFKIPVKEIKLVIGEKITKGYMAPFIANPDYNVFFDKNVTLSSYFFSKFFVII